MRAAPEWLADFQAGFSVALRTPWVFSQGQVHFKRKLAPKDLDIVPRSHRSAEAGLDDYHRQYWFRLFTVLQNDFPVTAHVMGLWKFNQLAQTYLLQRPPRDYDLANVRKQFLEFVEASEPSALLRQAARLDDIRAEVFMASSYRVWQARAVPDPASIVLHAAPDWRIFHEDWSLVDLCLNLPQIKSHDACPTPQKLSRTWLIQRDEQGLMHRPLTWEQGRLYELLSEQSIGDAIRQVEGLCSTKDISDLSQNVQQWMSASVGWSLWAEFE